MLVETEFLKQSARSIIRYSLAQLIYLNSDDSRFYKLDRLNNTYAGKIARKTLTINNIIFLKSNFALDKFAMLNHDKRECIESMGIDTFINNHLMKDISTIIESIEKLDKD